MIFCELNLYGDIKVFNLHLFLASNKCCNTKTSENSIYVNSF